MEIGYELKVVTTARQLEKQILQEIVEQLNKIMLKNKFFVENNVRNVLLRAFKSQPEYISLQGGKLQSELGVVDAKRKIDAIIDRWVNSISLNIEKVKVVNVGFKGNISLLLAPAGFEDVLDMPEASYITRKGTKIEWLRWLLFEGDKYIIREYDVGPDKTGIARTGLGQIMIRTKKNGWRVPPEYSGIAIDNFATRALISVQDELNNEIFGIVK